MNKECDCKHSGIRIVRGNDVTIEAVVSVFDKATGTYSPSDLSEVEGKLHRIGKNRTYHTVSCWFFHDDNEMRGVPGGGYDYRTRIRH